MLHISLSYPLPLIASDICWPHGKITPFYSGQKTLMFFTSKYYNQCRQMQIKMENIPLEYHLDSVNLREVYIYV